jgi:hypothetical protein
MAPREQEPDKKDEGDNECIDQNQRSDFSPAPNGGPNGGRIIKRNSLIKTFLIHTNTLIISVMASWRCLIDTKE